MKKKFFLILITIILSVLMLTAVSCKKQQPKPGPNVDDPIVTNVPELSAPTGLTRNNDEPLKFVWSKVDGAASYRFELIKEDNTVQLSKDIIQVANTFTYSVTLNEEELAVHNFKAQVTAIGDGVSYKTSKPSNQLSFNVEYGSLKGFPKEINTVDELMLVDTYPTYHFKLMNDLTLTAPIKPLCYNNVVKNGEQVTYLGFMGSFNGNNKTIKNVVLNTTENLDTMRYYGLFSVLNQAKVYDLNIVDFKADLQENIFIRYASVGALAGAIVNSEINNVNVIKLTANHGINWITYNNYGNVTINAGGLIGESEGGSKISNCITDIYIGVDIDFLDNAEENPSYDNTVHKSTANVGGLIGFVNIKNNLNNQEISNCTAKGNKNITAHEVNSGGFVGLVNTQLSSLYKLKVNNSKAYNEITVNEPFGVLVSTTVPQKFMGHFVGNAYYIDLDTCETEVSYNVSNLVFNDKPYLKDCTNVLGFIGITHTSPSTAENFIKDCSYKEDSANLANFNRCGIVSDVKLPNNVFKNLISPKDI